MSYTLTQKEFVRLKSKLTRAVNSKDPKKIIATVDAAMRIFEEKGYPDSWHRWEAAKRDAQWASRFSNPRKKKRGKYARRRGAKKHVRRKARLGSGVRFRTLAEEIKKAARKRGYRIGSIGGLVAAIGRKKWGKSKFAALSKRGKRRKGRR